MDDMAPVSPLAALTETFAKVARQSSGALCLAEIACQTQLSLRASPGSESAAAASALLGVARPGVPNTVTSGNDTDILWLGPDEWLIVTNGKRRTTLEHQLVTALDGLWGSVVDVSAQRTILEIGGQAAREVLARGCAIDLDDTTFGPGHCAQTLLGQAQVILQPVAGGVLRIFVRASFARYVADWLLDASVEERLF